MREEELLMYIDKIFEMMGKEVKTQNCTYTDATSKFQIIVASGPAGSITYRIYRDSTLLFCFNTKSYEEKIFVLGSWRNEFMDFYERILPNRK